MGRPTKQGVEYFSVDCTFDHKTNLYIVEMEAEGLAVLVVLWQMIYSENGYYIDIDDDLYLLIKKAINVDKNIVIECIKIMLKRNIFSAEKYDKHKILTSRAIQKRYFDYAKRKKVVLYDFNYILKGIDVGINSINVSKNATKEQEHIQLHIQGQEQGNITEKPTSKKEFLFPDNSQEFNRAFEDFAEMRKNQKKPLTARAKELAFKTLQKLSKYEDVQIQIMEQSTMNCYQGLFPLKQNNNNSKPDKNDAFMNMVYNEKTGLLE